MQELEGLEWPELVTALDIDRNDPTVYRIDRLVIRTYYQSDVGLVGCVAWDHHHVLRCCCVAQM